MFKRFNLSLCFVVAFASLSASAGPYISTAVSISTETGEPLILNRDVECIAVEKSETTPQTTALIKLDPVSRRYFQDFTRANLGKSLDLKVCAAPIRKIKIQDVVSTGTFFLGDISATEAQCLRDTFKVSKSCSDCPICKN